MTQQTALAATLFGPEDLRMVERPLGPLAEGMVRIKFGAAGICGSDMHYFRHARTGDFVVTSPLVLGHEIAGEVVEINATRYPAEGRRPRGRQSVALVRTLRPLSRGPRQSVREHLLHGLRLEDTAHAGRLCDAISTQFLRSASSCRRICRSTSAALAEPLAVCLHAVSRAGDLTGKRVALFGAGPIGLLTMLAAKQAGAGHLTMVDIAAGRSTSPRSWARTRPSISPAGNEELLAAAAEKPFDVVFEVTGAPPALALCIRTVRRGGTVVQIGNLPGGEISVPANAIMAKEIDFRGAFRFGQEFKQAVKLIVAGKIDVQQLITARRPLSDAPAALRLALDRSQSVKVVLEG